MSQRRLGTASVLILFLIACGCTSSIDSPAAPEQVLQTNDAGGASFGTTGKHDHQVEICHATGNGNFIKVSIGKDAEPGHIAHGDGHPNDGTFDENCQQAGLGGCPCFSAADLLLLDPTFDGKFNQLVVSDNGLTGIYGIVYGRRSVGQIAVAGVLRVRGQREIRGCQFGDFTVPPSKISPDVEVVGIEPEEERVCREMIRSRWPQYFPQ